MSNVINLNKARKKKQRAEQDKTADENRVKFGRTKADKATEQMQAERSKRQLDDHKSVEDE